MTPRLLLVLGAMFAACCLTACGSDVGTIGEQAAARTTGVADGGADVSLLTDGSDATTDVSAEQLERPRPDRVEPPTPRCSDDSDAAADANTRRSAEDVLAGYSDECLGCASTRCPMSLDSCSNLAGCAEGGAAVRRSRAALCSAALECLMPPQCNLPNPGDCICESRFGVGCLKWENNLASSCRVTIQQAMESDDLEVVATGLHDVSKAGGAAFELVQCLRNRGCDSCFQGLSDAGRRVFTESGVPDATLPDAAVDAGAETGPPAAKCGNGIVEGTEACDNGFVNEDGVPSDKCTNTGTTDKPVWTCDSCSILCTDQSACLSCLAFQCPGYDSLCTGRQFPSDPFELKACQTVYACILSTNCAVLGDLNGQSEDVLACYCGKGVSFDDCMDRKNVTGLCRGAFEDAFGTVTPSTIQNLMSDITRGGGAAVQKRLCEIGACPESCHYGRVVPALTDAGAADGRAPL